MSRIVPIVLFGAIVLPFLLAASPGEESGAERAQSKANLELPNPPARFPAATIQANACLKCHMEMADLLVGDKHITDDFHCVVCHGASTKHLEMEQEGDLPDRTWRRWVEEKNGFTWRMQNASLEIARFCASCHDAKAARGAKVKTIDWKAYLATGHGQAVARGSRDAPTCTDCHYAHGAGAEPLTDEVVVGRCGLCHNDRQMMQRAGVDPNTMNNYGAATGETTDAATGQKSDSCIGCHAPH